MSSTNLGVFRAAVADEALPLAERKLAAERYIAKIMDEVPETAEDDAGIAVLMTPPKRDEILGDLYIKGWGYANTKRGWAESGPTVEQARESILSGRRKCAVLSVVVDESAHRLERLAACQHILDGLDPRHIWKVNTYNPEKVLSKVKPASATKYVGWNKPDIPVARPPQSTQDVW